MRRKRKIRCRFVLLVATVLWISGCGYGGSPQGEVHSLGSVNLQEAEGEADAVKEQSDVAQSESSGAEKGAAESESQEADSHIEEGEADTQKEKIWVYISGAVHSPGVYAMAEGSRVFQLVEMAGGMRPDAAVSYLNQAAVVTDGQQIYLPTQEEADQQKIPLTEDAQPAGGSASASEETASKVNINTASAEELMTIRGVGSSRAESIIDYREQHGAFGAIEDIMQVDGIKDGMFAKIKDSITVN